MNDLNTILRQHAANGLQTQLDTAVQNGDTTEARRISGEIASLAVQTAPKASAYNDNDIRESLGKKADWFGIDPKKSAKVVEFGKTMDPKRFATADAFADAVIKAVDDEFKPAGAAAEEDEDGDTDVDADKGDEGKGKDKNKAAARAARRTDGPGDVGVRPNARANTGPWKTIDDAPADVRKEINRQRDKLGPKTEDGRKNFVERALKVAYEMHERQK